MQGVRVLVADDEPVSRTVVAAMLRREGYDVVVAADGAEALAILSEPGAPPIAVLDWMMPGLDGTEVLRRLRSGETSTPTWVVLLTSRDSREDIVAGLGAGADDYVTKPPDEAELAARLRVGVRVVQLQQALADRVAHLQDALSHVKQLHGLLPICSYCKRIRDDGNYWRQVESYIAEHADVQFSHSYCPDCYAQHVEPQLRDYVSGMKDEEP
ncbi:MAG: response regulator transcription factor [Vicinamibacterales bacterium]